jgi:lipoprotein-anchoring transpeptidase ErfK/SrfK
LTFRALQVATLLLVLGAFAPAADAASADRTTTKQATDPAKTETPSARSRTGAQTTADDASQAADPAPATDAAKPCRWWQLHCKSGNDNAATTSSIEGLPPEAPRQGTVITVDTSTNTLYLFRDGNLITKGPAATGTERTLTKGLKQWMFHTPRGHLKVLRKIDDPVWRKPDWAFVEAGHKIPPPDSPKRLVRGHLGKYALDLGDGIMIHGTDEIDSLGRHASHGCVRLGSETLETVYQSARVGTDVFIY